MEELFFVMLICSYQNMQGPACSSIAEAYFKKIDGQKSLDNVNKKYIDPLPDELKKVGIIGLTYYNQKIHLGLNRHLSFDTSFEKGPNLQETNTSNTLTFHIDFP